MITILLAVDGSEGALRATRKLIDSARWYKEPLVVELVTVHLPVPRIGGLAGTIVSQQMVDKYYEDEGAQNLAASKALLDDAGVSYHAHVLVGGIAETIVEQSLQMHCQMIYMGTRGMVAIANMVMGSIATKVVHLASVPVVLVP